MSIPIFINITRPNFPKYETLTFNCSSLEDCKNKLIVNLKNLINKKIDYPEDIDDFATLFWYNENYMNNDFFEYQIFYENNWTKPWSLQELYDTVLEIINQVDIQDCIYNKNNYYDNTSDSDEEKTI